MPVLLPRVKRKGRSEVEASKAGAERALKVALLVRTGQMTKLQLAEQMCISKSSVRRLIAQGERIIAFRLEKARAMTTAGLHFEEAMGYIGDGASGD